MPDIFPTVFSFFFFFFFSFIPLFIPLFSVLFFYFLSFSFFPFFFLLVLSFPTRTYTLCTQTYAIPGIADSAYSDSRIIRQIVSRYLTVRQLTDVKSSILKGIDVQKKKIEKLVSVDQLKKKCHWKKAGNNNSHRR